MKYFHKDSTGNVYTRCNNEDHLLLKFSPKSFEPFLSSCNGKMARTEGIWPYIISRKDFLFGAKHDLLILENFIAKKNYYTFSKNFGCVVGMLTTERCAIFL